MDKVVEYVNQSITELKRVQWPNKKETVRLTSYVIGISFGIGIFIMVFDYLFKEMLTLILTR